LVAAGFLLPGTFTRGQWGRVCESAAGDLLAEARATGRSALQALEARTGALTNDDTAAEALLTALGI